MTNSLQNALFTRILTHFDKRAKAVEKLSLILSVGKDAVYRRLRGDTMLSPDEMGRLAKEFNISLDALVYEQSDTVFFSYDPISQQLNNFEDYLTRFLEELELGYSSTDTYFYYASSELPLFLSCFYPELIKFKLYIWGLTALDFDYLKNVKFDFDMIPPPVMRVANRIAEVYKLMSSIELWDDNIISNTLTQFEYHLSMGKFKNPEDALLLCERLTELTYHMQTMAEKGRKFLPGQEKTENAGSEFSLYHNQIMHTNNTILGVHSNGKILFSSLCNPNVLRTTDENICNYVHDWMEKVISKSVSISSNAERDRLKYFNKLRSKIEACKTRIQNEIELAE